VARRLTLAVAAAVALLAVVGAGGAATQETPKRGGTLVFAQPQPEPACLNVLLERCADGTAAISLGRISDRVLEAPFEVGPDFAWRPKLVSRATFTRRSPFVLTYLIRPEARWSDGVPVTARDFAFTHRAILAHGSPEVRELHTSVRSVAVVGVKTVRVVLRSRIAEWRGLFGPILPAHALAGERLEDVWRDRIENPRTGRPIASGPFLVERWERGRQVVLVRNPRYWGPQAPYLERIVVRSGVDGSTLADDFRRGMVQLAFGFPAVHAAEVRRAAGVEVAVTRSTAWEHLDFSLGPPGNPLLQNKLIRRAIAFGIDRVALARQLSRETGLEHTVHHSAVLLSQERHYAPNWRRYVYRPAESRRLLGQAGCTRGGDGIYVCGGDRLSLRGLAHVSAGSIRPRVLALVQAQLRQAGIELLPEFAPQAAVFGSGGILEQGTFDVVTFAWVRTAPIASARELYACGAFQNYMRYCQRLVTEDLNQARRILDAEQLARVLNRVDVQLANDAPVLPLFQHPVWAAVAEELRAYRVIPGIDPLLGVENWWLDD
jgi:peptide/nickel transport system substrate-binding protein